MEDDIKQYAVFLLFRLCLLFSIAETHFSKTVYTVMVIVILGMSNDEQAANATVC